MNFTLLENVLWAAGFAGNLTLLAVLLIKHRVRSFPVFGVYIAYQVVETATLYQVARGHSHHAYFLAYWAFAAGDYVGQIAVIFEMARDVLRPTGSWVKDARRSFLFWSAMGTLAAGGFASAITPPQRNGLELWAIRSSLFTSFLTCEVFLAMSTAANRLGLQWRNHVMTLGQGLTFWASIALVVDVAHYATGWRSSARLLDDARSGAYVAAVVFWIVTFALPERRRQPLSPEMQQYLVALHQDVQYDLKTTKPENRRPL